MYKERWQPILALVLGVYIIATPWLIPYLLKSPALLAGAAWSHYAAGLAIVVAAIFAIMSFEEWTAWLEALLGLWIIIAPWALGFSALSVFTWSSVIVGIALIVSAIGALSSRLMQSL